MAYVAGGDAGMCEHGVPWQINSGMAAREVGHQSRTVEQVARIQSGRIESGRKGKRILLPLRGLVGGEGFWCEARPSSPCGRPDRHQTDGGTIGRGKGVSCRLNMGRREEEGEALTV